ncbi:hypothetical protein [Cellulosimicrobium aquatile]|uniref:hypothetical protein n=1 Tax=Cellulosimicrobium aquatile TaxID=1612203 RepID=UPI001459B4C6|nr:hypothetical protein [Cellulosimicrobium aquatile]NMF27917.1 hypothetical protein [Cellulosimicrobium aquatile]
MDATDPTLWDAVWGWVVGAWNWLLVPGGLITLILLAALAAVWKRLRGWFRAWRQRRYARLRAKWSTPCDRPHLDDLGEGGVTEVPTPAPARVQEFVLPAKFEVRGEHPRAGDPVVACFLVNLGPGIAKHIIGATDPFGNCRVRGQAYADQLAPGGRLPITVACNFEDTVYDQTIRVSWTDEAGVRHEDDDAEVAPSGRDAMIIE